MGKTNIHLDIRCMCIRVKSKHSSEIKLITSEINIYLFQQKRHLVSDVMSYDLFFCVLENLKRTHCCVLVDYSVSYLLGGFVNPNPKTTS